MIYVKVQLQSSDKKPKPIFMRGDDMAHIMSRLSNRTTINRQPVWHTITIHTISEAEYRKNTHPSLPGI